MKTLLKRKQNQKKKVNIEVFQIKMKTLIKKNIPIIDLLKKKKKNQLLILIKPLIDKDIITSKIRKQFPKMKKQEDGQDIKS